ncbi:MAG: solute-binding protein [Lentisphaerae bacterium]|nr:solute-binding protein [Lentisphaerota bacterium]
MKPTRILFIAVVWLAAVLSSPGQSLVVMADPLFQPVLEELAPRFAERTGFELHLSTVPSDAVADRIQSGESADVVFPADENSMRRLMGLGLVDVALKRNILAMPGESAEETAPASDPQYASAAVLAGTERRIQAMAFLDYLASDDARGAFERQGFTLP